MKITDLQVDGFGVWSNLELRKLNDGLTVFYGPNEAGKTTLMQFIRTLLHGFSPQRCDRYLPPLCGGQPGGMLKMSGANGRFELTRHLPEGVTISDAEEINLTAADGTVHGTHFLSVLLSGIDETIFNNVFAVGLREMQELGTLSDTEAAQLLYDLSAGLDHVSLVEVMRDLDVSREKLLSSQDQSSTITTLLIQREQLQTEIQNLESISTDYAELRNQRDHIKQEIANLEVDSGEYESQLREIDLAATLAEEWNERAALDQQIAAIGPVNQVSAAILQQLCETNELLASRQLYRQRVQKHKNEIRRRAKALPINQALWQAAPKIEALNEQRPWLDTISRRMKELNAELELADSQLHEERTKLGLQPTASLDHVWTDGNFLSGRTITKLRPLAKMVKEAKKTKQITDEELISYQQELDSSHRELRTALSDQKEHDLTKALETSGEQVSQLRRRLATDDRLEQLQLNEKELEQQIQSAMHNRVLPAWTMIATGAGFALGIVLIIIGFFLPSMFGVGVTIAILGVLATAAAAGTKIMLERSAEQQLESSTQQLEMVQLQIERTKVERDELNQQIPSGGGPLTIRLQTAEARHLELEKLLPLQTQYESATRKISLLESRTENAQQELQRAKKRWRDGLQNAGLPEDYSLSQVKALMRGKKHLAKLRRGYDRRAAELTQLQQSFDAVNHRVAQLADQAGLQDGLNDPLYQIQQLTIQMREQENLRNQYDGLRRKYRKMRLKDRKCARNIAALQHRRNELIIQAGVDSEDELRQLAIRHEQQLQLQTRRDAIQQQLLDTIAGQCSEQALAVYLDTGDMEILERKYDDLTARLDAYKIQLKQHYEHLGSLSEKLRSLSDDRRICHAQLDLNCVQQQLDDAYHQWQVLAVTSHVLETIRREYETDRQPETLKEASLYLQRMTLDRYQRVWTPLGQNVLRVDDHQGNVLPVEVLSRGTREQLFLSLRLSIAASYSRSGAFLPIVLDDVLVNFDATRAKAAADVLRDFADSGHQILLFTCHEHIQKIFKSAKVNVRRLPDRTHQMDPLVVTSKVKKSAAAKKITPKKKSVPPKIVETPQPIVERVEPTVESAIEQVVEEKVAEKKVSKKEVKQPPPSPRKRAATKIKNKTGPFTWDDDEKLTPSVADDLQTETKPNVKGPDESGFWVVEETPIQQIEDELEDEYEDEIVLEEDELEEDEYYAEEDDAEEDDAEEDDAEEIEDEFDEDESEDEDELTDDEEEYEDDELEEDELEEEYEEDELEEEEEDEYEEIDEEEDELWEDDEEDDRQTEAA